MTSQSTDQSDISPSRAAPSRGPGRPRQNGERGPEVRERLLEAAMALAAEQGFDACGLREIAARADVSPGMISYYFGDRQGLYEAMFQQVIDRIGGQVSAILAEGDHPASPNDGDASGSESASGLAQLSEIIRLHVAAISADPWLPQLLAREVMASGESRLRTRFAESVGSGPLMPLIKMLEEECSRGTIREDLDPRLLAMSIASLSAFPFLMLPIIGDRIGLTIDESFPARLIEHNQKLVTLGIRAQTENEG